METGKVSRAKCEGCGCNIRARNAHALVALNDAARRKVPGLRCDSCRRRASREPETVTVFSVPPKGWGER